jgi:hypothetical protein
MIARMETDSEGGTVSIYHDGGDPLEKGRFAILVDGVDRTADFSLIDAAGEKHEIWTSWKTGEALVLDTNGTENLRIQIVGEGVRRTGGDWLLHDLGNGTAVTPTTGPTPTETAGPTPVPLAANFTANVTYGTAPLAVRFTDTSTGGPTAWLWDFGDNATSTDRHPTHIYAAPGNYTVSLTVTGPGPPTPRRRPGTSSSPAARPRASRHLLPDQRVHRHAGPEGRSETPVRRRGGRENISLRFRRRGLAQQHSQQDRAVQRRL